MLDRDAVCAFTSDAENQLSPRDLVLKIVDDVKEALLRKHQKNGDIQVSVKNIDRLEVKASIDKDNKISIDSILN